MYRQLKDFLRQSDQKGFWIFNYSNIAGAGAGYFAARYLLGALPWLPGIITYLVLVIGGVWLTWPHEGRSNWRSLWNRGQFWVRRLIARQSIEIHSAAYYRVEQSSIRPFSVDGRVTYSGDQEDLSKKRGT